ncbi:MAG: tetratricopeptide repeat protein [Pelatocladus maniniholoensis HA4357-MV3]|jgi:WD40 repeat protein/tRNA A-37 threonylcarbamoyl transferase component Bud32|uniref:Tetratricopeptide repeat protein n=1 Tax=Pelatocladus maniniholoensis HA4357-MV3 TaxID=1117104 RepID=A0A9E3H4M0_9NOST|nr:tetratricopeptide repeat protein [Pelatocladus maniniholoensis HA4357-MV3]
MQICQNPNCSNPFNPDGNRFCTSCGANNFGTLFKNRYRMSRLLGEGGFGRTYEAQDIDRLDSPCVIKQFVPQVQGTAALSKAASMFKEEARRLYELGENHAQIPRLVAYFGQGANLYLVQELIAGDTLLTELLTQEFNEAKIRELLADLLPILQFVHDRNVIHRDIKPENIIRRHSDRKLVLIDFGGAKQVTQTTFARQGTGIYTIGYAPLEQMQGYAYPASDIYALGATCVRLLTGFLPLQDGFGNLTDALYDVRNARWLWRECLQDKGVSVSKDLEQIIEKMLKHFVPERYQSAQEVLQDLQAKPVAAVPPTIPINFEAYNFWGLDKAQRLDYQGAIADFNQALQMNPNYVEAWTNRGDVYLQMGDYQAALADYNQALSINPNFTAAIAGRNKITAMQQVQTPSHRPLNLSNAVFAYALSGHTNIVRSVAFTQNGQSLVSGSNDKTIRIWNLQKRQLQGMLSEKGEWVVIAISPDGQTLASGSSNKTIKIWHLQTGKLLSVLKGHFDLINGLCFSPDGQNLVSASRDRTIKIWHVKTGKLQRTLGENSGFIYDIAISSDGNFLVSGGSDKLIKIWQLQTGELLRTIAGFPGFVRTVAISSILQVIVGAGFGKTIYVWDLHNGQLQQVLEGHNGSIQTLAISSDGQSLISGSDDRTLKIWNLKKATLLHTLTGHTGSVLSVDISSDGNILASSSEDKTIRIWQAN